MERGEGEEKEMERAMGIEKDRGERGGERGGNGDRER